MQETKMKKGIIIFAGTSEGRRLSELLSAAGIAHIACVATEYGEAVLREDDALMLAGGFGVQALSGAAPGQVTVHRGRMNAEEMEAFFREENTAIVVDATHPYAAVVTENIRAAANAAGVSYLRLLRESVAISGEESGRNADLAVPGYRILFYESTAACAAALAKAYAAAQESAEVGPAGDGTAAFSSAVMDEQSGIGEEARVSGSILLTTGSKELSVFTQYPALKAHLIARVLPGLESIRICEENGIPGKQIVAMQGPFSEEMNKALIRDFHVSYLVTKNSGRAGGLAEKLQAAQEMDVPVLMIGRPLKEEGSSFEEVVRELETRLTTRIVEQNGATLAEAGFPDTARRADAGEDSRFSEEVPGIVAEEDSGRVSLQAAGVKAQGGANGPFLEITLAGIGMGDAGSMTKACAEAIENADILLGAKRMIAPYNPRIAKMPYYLSKDIVPYLAGLQRKLQRGEPPFSDRLNAEDQIRTNEADVTGNVGGKRNLSVVILFSGDSGFCSGTRKVYEALLAASEDGTLRASVRILPGISSISYLAAKTGIPYSEAVVTSIHGKTGWEAKLLSAILCNRYTYFLTSGKEDLAKLGELLVTYGLFDVRIHLGYALGSAKEEVIVVDPVKCMTIENAGLYTCLAENSAPEERMLTHGLPDTSFTRGKVPMTKEEVRTVSISKLHLTEGSIVYDIGSGTGSIAVEIARHGNRAVSGGNAIRGGNAVNNGGVTGDGSMARGGGASGIDGPGTTVYAIERNEEALALIEENAKLLGAPGVIVVPGEAPEALADLPAPTHAFIGGSGGNLEEILRVLYAKNPTMRIVITAVTMETAGEMTEALRAFPVAEEEITQLSVARGRKAGRYHLMTAENPVWICAFRFVPGGAEG